MKPLNKYMDHTLLKADATDEDIKKLCREALDYGFYAVCVNSCHVPLVSRLLAGSDVKIAAVVDFPLGAAITDSKACETEMAVSLGADEIDMVINIGALKEKRYDFVRDDIEAVVKVAAKKGAIVKVILETCLLTDEEIVTACQLAKDAGAAFVKTSTGFSTAGATVHHVRLMKDTVGDAMQVKASGGIRDKAAALAMIEAGADRIGASASVEICRD